MPEHADSSARSPSNTPPLRSPQQELEAFALRRIASLRRVGDEESVRIDNALQRALELLAEAEDEDDPA